MDSFNYTYCSNHLGSLKDAKTANEKSVLIEHFLILKIIPKAHTSIN